MSGLFRTPSPAPEARISGATAMPRTPDVKHSRLFARGGEITLGEHQSAPSGLANPAAVSNLQSQTPTCKRLKINCQGLPSPQTPPFSTGARTQESTGRTDYNELDSSKKLIDDFWTGECADRSTRPSFSPITPRSASFPRSSKVTDWLGNHPLISSSSIEGDADLALELSGSSPLRRSTRIKNTVSPQVIDKLNRTIKPVKPASKALSPAPQQLPRPVITQAEPTVSPFQVSISSSGEIPTLHSTDWQLQYPPGGSTHPSYPWPTADPRLSFQTYIVPLSNGLPDASLVPALVLPIGWHQATWCGLHPIVFDPHRQAFKLTPIGPLPLTCEELHQGGLQDYVPGGKLHPEAGLLPTLLSFTDGSDTDVFNFEGVDWTLPWADYESVLPVEANVSPKVGATLPDLRVPPVVSGVQTPPSYLETRDCPDGIIDLDQGWLWLSEREGSFPLSFTATPGRTWRGTGVHHTSRRFKAPIPSLMAISMAEREADNKERYLLNQDTREFNAFKSVATPVHVNIALLQDVEFTLLELLSYFPFHYQWRRGGDRLVCSGMSASDIANFINMLRCLPGATSCHKRSVDDHVFWDQLEDGTKVKILRSGYELLSYSAEHWTYSVWETTDYPLLALAHGLIELPSGPDAGPLTSLIKWCRQNKRHKIMLSEAPKLLREAGIDSLIEPGNGADPDQEVLARRIEAVKKDRLRVLKEIRVLKVEKEIGASREENKTKKRRLE